MPWQIERDAGDCAAAPAQGELGAAILLLDRDDDFLKDGTQEFFFVARRCRGRLPGFRQVGTERQQALPFGRGLRDATSQIMAVLSALPEMR